MHPDRPQDVVDKQPASLVGMAEGGQQQAPEAGNRDIVDARAGLLAQIANSRRVGLVRDRVQRRTRQIKAQRVMGLVEETGRISFQVPENDLTGANRSPVLVGRPPNIHDGENRGVAKRREKHLPAESDRSFAAADCHIESP